ncbi:hypothetical protein Ndes2526B_g09273 [Nannochloris sp. 'desiccata']
MEVATRGRLLLTIVSISYIYYTIWVLGTPFIDSDQTYILKLFPDTYYALAIPLFSGIVLIGVTLATLGAFLVSGELAKLRQTKAKAS